MGPDEVVIVGAGPAGVTAAIQLKRYGVPFALLEKERIGGLLWNANLVENCPGFPAGISGPRLVGLIEKQMQRLGVEVIFDGVTRIVPDAEGLRVETNRTSFRPRYVIVASGTRPRPYPLKIPPAAQDRVLSEVFPLLEVGGKKIVIIGAGDAAFDYALNLSKKRNSVTILNRGRDVKCLSLLCERAAGEPRIVYRAGTRLCQVEAGGTAGRLRLVLRQGLEAGTGSPREEASEIFEADYLLFAIGRLPQTDFLPAGLAARKHPGLRLVGDVKNGAYRQAAIAAGDGLRAAMEIYYQLNSEA